MHAISTHVARKLCPGLNLHILLSATVRASVLDLPDRSCYRNSIRVFCAIYFAFKETSSDMALEALYDAISVSS